MATPAPSTPVAQAAPVAPAPPPLTWEQQQAKQQAAAYEIEVEKSERARLLEAQINAAAAAGHIIPTSILYAQEKEIQNIGKVPATPAIPGLPDAPAGLINTTAPTPPPAPGQTTPAGGASLNPIVVPPKNHHMRNFFILFLIATVAVVYLITQQSDPVDQLEDKRASEGGEAGVDGVPDSDAGTTTSSSGKASLGFLLSSLGLFLVGWVLAFFSYKRHKSGKDVVITEGENIEEAPGGAMGSFRGSMPVG